MLDRIDEEEEEAGALAGEQVDSYSYDERRRSGAEAGRGGEDGRTAGTKRS